MILGEHRVGRMKPKTQLLRFRRENGTVVWLAVFGKSPVTRWIYKLSWESQKHATAGSWTCRSAPEPSQKHM